MACSAGVRYRGLGGDAVASLRAAAMCQKDSIGSRRYQLS